MKFLGRLNATLGARADARHGIDGSEDRLIGQLGKKPELNVLGSYRDRRLVDDLDGVRLGEIGEDVLRAEDEVARHASPLLYTAGLWVAFGLETVGSVMLAKALGRPESERIFFGIALAIGVIAITAFMAKKTGEKPSVKGAIVLVVYGLLVGAVTIARLRTIVDEEASQLEALAEAALTVAMSVGPAWFAEYLLRKRAPAVAAVKELRKQRRRLRAEERKQRDARTAVERIEREGRKWEAEAARLRALYRTEHRLESAKEGNER